MLKSYYDALEARRVLHHLKRNCHRMAHQFERCPESARPQPLVIVACVRNRYRRRVVLRVECRTVVVPLAGTDSGTADSLQDVQPILRSLRIAEVDLGRLPYPSGAVCAVIVLLLISIATKQLPIT